MGKYTRAFLSYDSDTGYTPWKRRYDKTCPYCGRTGLKQITRHKNKCKENKVIRY